MTISKRTLIIYLVSLGAFILAVFYFIKTNELRRALKLSEENRDSIIYALNQRSKKMSELDSLLLTGDYNSALKGYKDQLASSDSSSFDLIQQRIELTKKFIQQSRRVVNVDSVNQDTISMDTLAENTRRPTAEEIRNYDSLSFALRKYQIQLDRLKSQLQKKSYGEYLTFSSKKGNSVHYVGQVQNGKANGHGIALLNTGSRYEGEWKDNLRHGEGKFYWPDGEYYIGEYKDDLRSGVGTYYWPNGEKFVGEWQNDQRSGQGTFYNEKGEIVAKGVWKKDELVRVEEK
ncbi:MORN repeat-containing protein [Marinigracilibium pacificum]|uniref:MORN repeat protein n=1 Tax=Marinigracilibium pacificum TaxID=2729599 RepID=A0A848IZY5_9BACT|nr:hypothetical protein [Marinigracilibium pacificum]NMM47860.1 hypothetical protein [Marinigracilibium pacificum]